MNEPSYLTLAFKKQRAALALALKKHKKALTDAGKRMQDEIKDKFNAAERDVRPTVVEAQRRVAERIRDVAQWAATQALAMHDPKSIKGAERTVWKLLEIDPEKTYVILSDGSLWVQSRDRGMLQPMDDALIFHDHERILKALREFTYRAVLSS